MKVLIINDFSSMVGGAERLLEYLMNEGNSGGFDFYRLNIADIVEGYASTGYLREKYSRITITNKLIRALDEKIKAIDPDIIHLNNNNLYTNSVSKCLRNRKSRIVCFIHDYCALKRLSLFFYPYFSDRFIYVTHSLDIYKRLIEIKKQAYLVKVPFNHNKWNQPEIESTRNYIADLLFVGRVERRKGIFKLIRAVEIIRQKIPTITLAVLGAGSGNNLLEKIVKNKNLTANIVLKGLQPDQEIIRYYCNSRICIFPSAEESLGYVGLEAQSCGIPVVAFQNKGINRWCHDYKNGFIVNGNSSSRLADKVMEIIHDEELLKKISTAAKNSILLETYNASEREITDIYKTVLAC